MKTVFVGLKDFRQNISKFKDQSQKYNITYIITVRNKPVFEVKPIINQEIDSDNTQIEYYNSVESSLNFWHSNEDEDIFKLD